MVLRCNFVQFSQRSKSFSILCTCHRPHQRIRKVLLFSITTGTKGQLIIINNSSVHACVVVVVVGRNELVIGKSRHICIKMFLLHVTQSSTVTDS